MANLGDATLRKKRHRRSVSLRLLLTTNLSDEPMPLLYQTQTILTFSHMDSKFSILCSVFTNVMIRNRNGRENSLFFSLLFSSPSLISNLNYTSVFQSLYTKSKHIFFLLLDAWNACVSEPVSIYIHIKNETALSQKSYQTKQNIFQSHGRSVCQTDGR